MYVYFYLIKYVAHYIFSAIVSGCMDWTDCFLIVCFHFPFVHFLIYSLKTGLDLLQYSQLRWGCDSPRLLCPVPSGRRNWETDRAHRAVENIIRAVLVCLIEPSDWAHEFIIWYNRIVCSKSSYYSLFVFSVNCILKRLFMDKDDV